MHFDYLYIKMSHKRKKYQYMMNKLEFWINETHQFKIHLIIRTTHFSHHSSILIIKTFENAKLIVY